MRCDEHTDPARKRTLRGTRIAVPQHSTSMMLTEAGRCSHISKHRPVREQGDTAGRSARVDHVGSYWRLRLALSAMRAARRRRAQLDRRPNTRRWCRFFQPVNCLGHPWILPHKLHMWSRAQGNGPCDLLEAKNLGRRYSSKYSRRLGAVISLQAD